MSKGYRLSAKGAKKEINNFIKRQESKIINKKTIDSFGKLLKKLNDNFKDYDTLEILGCRWEMLHTQAHALRCIRNKIIIWERGGSCRIKLINGIREINGEYFASINGSPYKITKKDYDTLCYIFFNDYNSKP